APHALGAGRRSEGETTMTHLKQYGPEGPLGFPLADGQCRAVESLLRSLPRGKEYDYRHAVNAQAPTELSPGARADVSWITTQAVARGGEVVMARGRDNSQFALTPVVTPNPPSPPPPVGRSLWQKRVKDGDLAGVKAKTKYPQRPEAWDDAHG